MITTTAWAIANFPEVPEPIRSSKIAAADRYISDQVRWTGDVPPVLLEAVKLATNRLLARENSPDGSLGLDDLGTVRVPGRDPDIDRLIAPYRIAGGLA